MANGASPRNSRRATPPATTEPTAPTSLDDDERVRRLRELSGVNLSRKRALEAVTHRAFGNDHPGHDVHDYERLEFLGDAVLDLVAAETLLERFPDADEGELTQRRSAFVSEPSLAAAAMATGLFELIRLSKAQTSVGDDRLPSICADVVEAVIGAAFLEGGLEAARQVVTMILGAPHDVLVVVQQDEKTALQERIQAALNEVPTYDVTRSDGPDHKPTFTATVSVRAHVLGNATGHSKKVATQAAAKMANLELAALDDRQLLARFSS